MYNPKIVAACGWRYEDEWLVEDWKKNLAWVDGFAIIDDRDRPDDDLWGNEVELYRKQRELARELGADWILVSAPDERWDYSAEEVIRSHIRYLKRAILRVPIREMYTPTAYRSDRGWWRHEEHRIYALHDDQVFDNSPLHNSIVPKRDRFTKVMSIPTEVYHLKHIEPENRRARAAIYAALDPEAKLTVLKKYDQLTDETNMELTEIKPPKGFDPPYDRPYYFDPPGMRS